MALSGSRNFSQNRDELIKDALVSAGVIRDDETPSGTMNASAARTLNRMMKAWTAHGLQLWTHRETVLFLVDGQKSYTLGSGSDRWVLKDDLAETKLAAAYSAAATTLDVDSTTGMTAGDVIGIETAGNTMHWDTIASVDTATSLTITNGLAAAAAVDAYVAAYTSTYTKPFRIVDGYAIRYAEDTINVPLNIESRNDFIYLGNPESEGAPLNVWFNPNITDSKINVWPKPDADNHRLVLIAQYDVDDVDTATNDIGFPSYWLDALHKNLTYSLYMDYGRAKGDGYAVEVSRIEKRAKEALELAMDYDVENTHIQLQPEARWSQEH